MITINTSFKVYCSDTRSLLHYQSEEGGCYITALLCHMTFLKWLCEIVAEALGHRTSGLIMHMEVRDYYEVIVWYIDNHEI